MLYALRYSSALLGVEDCDGIDWLRWVRRAMKLWVVMLAMRPKEATSTKE